MSNMNRLEFLRCVGAAGASALLAPLAATADTRAPRRPNILWLSCEDMSAHLGCYGDPLAHTPTLDQFARDGIRFTHCFTAAPVCAPNRSCIITGVYPTTLGAHQMRAGGEGTMTSSMPALPSEIRCFTEYLRDAGYYCSNNSKEDYNFVTPKSAWDDSSNKAHWRNRPSADQPFFAVFNYTGTHESGGWLNDEAFAERTSRLTLEQRQDRAKMQIPPYHPDTPVVRENWARHYERITALDYWVADHLAQLKKDGLEDYTIVFFWSDHGDGLPRGKRWLYDSGTHVPVMVRFPKALQTERSLQPGTVDSRLISSIDFAPTVLKLLGLRIPEYMQGQPFFGLNQPKPRKYVFGIRDRMDERYDIIRSVRDRRYRYIRNYEPFKPYGQYLTYGEQSPIMQELRRLEKEGALTGATQWVAAKNKPVEELYDSLADPHEITNLANDPEHQDALKRLRGVHEKWVRDTDDLGLIPEEQLVLLGMQYGSRYAIARQSEIKKSGFLKRLREIAVLAVGPETRDLSGFLESLNAAEPSIRYWAVVGLALSGDHSETVIDELRKATTDPSGTVRVAAAKALLESDLHAEHAFNTLKAALTDDDEWVRLRAALAFDELGEKARPAIPELRKALEDAHNKYVVRVANHALNSLEGTNNKVQ
ncbi:MAG: hypothetical protein AMXMBFR4_05800 [Candidatus Hydrogenedentota bacterium]